MPATLDLDHIEIRKAEIVKARAELVRQVQTIQARIANIDGALEFIVMCEKDIAGKESAERAEAEAALAAGNAEWEASLIPANDGGLDASQHVLYYDSNTGCYVAADAQAEAA